MPIMLACAKLEVSSWFDGIWGRRDDMLSGPVWDRSKTSEFAILKRIVFLLQDDLDNYYAQALLTASLLA